MIYFPGEGRPVLDWEIRVKVAAGAARGIAYLHEDCELPLLPSIHHILYSVIIYPVHPLLC